MASNELSLDEDESQEVCEDSATTRQCSNSRKCSKADKHPGKCNKIKRFHQFWKTSRFQLRNVLKRKEKKAEEVTEMAASQLAELEKREEKIIEHEKESEKKAEELKKEEQILEAKIQSLKKESERLKCILRPSQQSRSKRINNPSTYDMIIDFNNSTRYRRRNETKDVLEYIHGGSDGAIYGAWDVIASNGNPDILDKLVGGYKRGRYLQEVVRRAINDYNNSDDALKQAISLKYQNHLSRRKFELVCKTQTSVFNADEEVWLPRNIKCLGTFISLPKIVCDSKVDTFVKSLDIGDVCQISYYPGVSRTVTGLVYMIIDLHLRLPRLRNKLRWFNDNNNHFVFQFSDDGAPETSQLGMSIGSLTCWNFESRVRSREFHYLLHCLSVSEKDVIMEDLWHQHADEMKLLEGSVLTICNTQCTVEFQPSADQSWQSWAGNELNQAATYPSPFADVHKGNLSLIGGSIGNDPGCTWHPPTKQSREKAIKRVQDFEQKLAKNLSSTTCHEKKLEFMASNGIRQLGEPRIGEFANRLRPEPLHTEINAWQHMLNMLYKEALQRGRIDIFLEVLSAPIDGDNLVEQCPMSHSQPPTHITARKETHQSSGDRVKEVEAVRIQTENFKQHMEEASSKAKEGTCESIRGCGLAFVASKVKEHYDNKDKRNNNLSVRIIGEQAISLAKYHYRLIDALSTQEESAVQKIKRQALAKACQHLRNAGTLFNKVDTNKVEIEELQENLTIYFNVLSLFFNQAVNISVWTVAYAIPYHARLLFQNYKIGYGIVSLQAKESKHASIKNDLKLTNRSRAIGTQGKWWQVMRANYVRSFYLPEHYPTPSLYVSHYMSRMPPHITDDSTYCECGRKKIDSDEEICQFCAECSDVLESAAKQELICKVYNILKPVQCLICSKRFADKFSCDEHKTVVHAQGISSSHQIIAKELSVVRLKEELKKRGLSTTGNKSILITRLEGRLATEV